MITSNQGPITVPDSCHYTATQFLILLSETLLFYDRPEYDVFWQTVSELDVPVYFHPRVNIAQISLALYQHSVYTKGPVQEYAATLSTHILGYVTMSMSRNQEPHKRYEGCVRTVYSSKLVLRDSIEMFISVTQLLP